MKVFTLTTLLSVFTIYSFAQNVRSDASSAATRATDAFFLKEPTYDFGKIPQGRPVTHDFEFVNKGSKPLIIESVEASCGCTSPQWSKAPVKPGESAVIKVGFNAAAQGHFSKSITIIYNRNEVKTITLTGDVYASPENSAPFNKSVSLLKQL